MLAPQIVMARELNNANAAKRFSHMSIYSRLQVATAPVTEERCCKRAISDGMSKLASSACISSLMTWSAYLGLRVRTAESWRGLRRLKQLWRESGYAQSQLYHDTEQRSGGRG
jgi:hypothetical protein